MSGERVERRSGEVDYSLADLHALARLISPTLWQLATIIGWLLLIGGIATFVLSRIVGTPYAVTDFLTVVAAAAALIVLGSKGTRARLWRWNLRKNRLYAPQTFVVRDDAFQVRSATGDLSLPWTSILSGKRADDRVFAFISRYSAYIVPRRAFDSDAEFAEFASAMEDGWRTSRQS